MSGKICAVVNCHSSYRFLKLWTKTRCLEHEEQLHEDCPCLQPFSFRRFPKNPELRKEWLRVINRKDFLPTDNSVVCSKHFIDGSRIPQLEMGYEKKVGVGHHHFAKNLAPLHKKRKMRQRNTWNGNHLGEENISLCTLDRLHTIIQLEQRKEETGLGLISDYEAKATRGQPKAEKRSANHDCQQGPSWSGGSLTVVKTERPSADEAPRFPFEDGGLDPLLHEMPTHSDDASLLDPLFDDSSQCSFYDGSDGRAMEIGRELGYDSLDLELRRGVTHLSSFDQTLCMPPSSTGIEMSDTLEDGLRHVHTPGDLTGLYDATQPWFEDVSTQPSTSQDESRHEDLSRVDPGHASRPDATSRQLSCKICGERFRCVDTFRSHLLKHMADTDKSYVL